MSQRRTLEVLGVGDLVLGDDDGADGGVGVHALAHEGGAAVGDGTVGYVDEVEVAENEVEGVLLRYMLALAADDIA